MLRRASAIVLSAFMLHLNLVRANVACASHDSAPAPAATNEHGASHHHVGSAANASATDGAGCETPVQRDCCHAVTSCAPVIGALSAERATLVPAAHDAIARAVQLRPHTRHTAPEPPPPRI